MRRSWLMISCLMAMPLGLVAMPASLQASAVQAGLMQPNPARASDEYRQWTGKEIVHESLRRHEFYPYVYEELTLVLEDAKHRLDVRHIRSYTRLEKDGTLKFLLQFVYPQSVAGSALLVVRAPDGKTKTRIFLPALGNTMTRYEGGMAEGQILGSEFSIEDLIPEDMTASIYRREPDIVADGTPYFVVSAVHRPDARTRYAYHERRLFIRQDNFFITRIDYLDAAGRLLKRLTYHDLHRVGGEMWRADMISVENLLNRQRSILKIDRRVYSGDYVPPSVFDEAHIVAAAEPVRPRPDKVKTGPAKDKGGTPKGEAGP